MMRVRIPTCAVSAFLLGACAPVEPSLQDLFTGTIDIVDMTHAMSATMPVWGLGANPFVHDTLARQPSGAPSMAAYRTPEHHGTHIDAPIHFADGQPSVDQIPVHQLFAPAAVIDVTAAAQRDPDYGLAVSDIEAWEAAHGPIPAGAVVLMASGWSSKWTDAAAYMARGDDGRMHFPGFSPEATRLLIEERDIVGIGVDTPSVDRGAASGFPAHEIANGAGRYHLENVAQVNDLPPAGAYVVVAPVKIEGGSGGQVRIFGIIPG